MPEFTSTYAIITLFYNTIAAPGQGYGGLLPVSGIDSSTLNPSGSQAPIQLWFIQVGIILSTASIFSLVLRRLRQPKVIAEILGGIILGPTAFGRIPGFTEHVFPVESLPYIGLVANIGLCLFLFLVGLEIDGTVIRRNARLSTTVALAGMIIPFGLGVALAVPIYHEFVDPNIQLTHFMLFTGVAFSITAFPVLCRILTELQLLDTTVGVVVLSAGIGNDIIGWVLLSLSVTLVNTDSCWATVWILLSCVGWTVFLLFPGKYALRWLARTTGSIENGPTVLFMTVTMLILFGSAFFTDVIGVHAIFGAFVAGIIVPREGSLAIALTGKLEDMVSIIFLPLYFTLSGLSTNLGLLDNPITWGFTLAIIVMAFIGKFGACAFAARYAGGFNWREASTIGSLMSCKGLVELIVLNVGLSAGILSQRVFSMFVLEALVLTFMTTPLVTTFYPPHLRRCHSDVKANISHLEDDENSNKEEATHFVDGIPKRRFTVVLNKLEHLPSAMALTQLIQPPSQVDHNHERISAGKRPSSNAALPQPTFSIEALRLVELSDRTLAKMRSSASDTLLHTDPLLAVFRMYGQLSDLPITPSMSIVPHDDMPSCVIENARRHASDLIMVPWLPPSDGPTIGLIDIPVATTSNHSPRNPFGALFKSTSGVEKSASAIHSQFVREVFAQSSVDVALFIDRTATRTGAPTIGSQHIFLPFFGGLDDRLALDFVVQICENPRVTATVLRMMKKDSAMDSPVPIARMKKNKEVDMLPEEASTLTVASTISDSTNTIRGQTDTEIRLQSEVADNISWAQYTGPCSRISSSSSLSRIEFRELATPIPLRSATQQCNVVLQSEAADRSSRLLVVAGRSRRTTLESHRIELEGLMREYGSVSADVNKTIGDVATAFIVAGSGAAVLVLQAASE